MLVTFGSLQPLLSCQELGQIWLKKKSGIHKELKEKKSKF
jgi:hypothetical protein